MSQKNNKMCLYLCLLHTCGNLFSLKLAQNDENLNNIISLIRHYFRSHLSHVHQQCKKSRALITSHKWATLSAEHPHKKQNNNLFVERMVNSAPFQTCLIISSNNLYTQCDCVQFVYDFLMFMSLWCPTCDIINSAILS